MRPTVRWEQVAPGVLLARDSCNVYALAGPEGVVVVDAGSGAWLDAVDELPGPPVAVLCTHFFRDHSAGTVAAARAGIPVWVPEGEESIFSEPELHHLRRETFNNWKPGYWHHFAPIEPVPVAGVLRDHDTVEFGGLQLEVVPLPGATIGQIGFAVRLPGVGKVVLCGETIHSAGRVPRLAPLQHAYLDLDGLYMIYGSIRELRRQPPDLLLPSLGDPIASEPEAALMQLQANIRSEVGDRMTGVGMPMHGVLDWFDGPELERLSDHVHRSVGVEGKTTFVVSESGRVLSIDYGMAFQGLSSGLAASPTTRRSILHSIDALEQLTGRRGIDVVVPTHYHDDHIGNVRALKRLFGTELWACEAFAAVIERPHDYGITAVCTAPAVVDRRLPVEQDFAWEEYRFTMGPLIEGGHTRYQAVFGFEADGLVYAAVGDQFMSRLLWYPRPDHSWEDDEWTTTCCYRSEQRLDGYRRSAEWLLELRPDVILNGHQPPIRTSELVFQRLSEFVERFEGLHRKLMPLADGDVHFDVDSAGATVRPYRVTMSEPGTARFAATVRNPLPHAAVLHVRMVGPQGLAGEVVTVDAGAHAEVDVDLALDVSGPWRRQPVALELVAGGRPFGQIAEALVTVGRDRW